MQFELTETTVLFSHLNSRTEKHGEDNVAAGDLKIRAQLSNDCLAMFHPSLKSSLYFYDKTADEDLVDKAKSEEPGYMPHLRFAQIEGFKWDGEIVGAKVTVHSGIDAKSDIALDDCKVNQFSLEPQNGGTVIVTMRIQMHPNEKQAGKLWAMVGDNIVLSVEPPPKQEEL